MVVEKKKNFALSAPAAWRGSFCNSQLSLLRELTTHLAVYHARVSTWAESVVERERAEVECRGFRVNALTWLAAFPEICCDQGLAALRADAPPRRKPVPCELSAYIAWGGTSPPSWM